MLNEDDFLQEISDMLEGMASDVRGNENPFDTIKRWQRRLSETSLRLQPGCRAALVLQEETFQCDRGLGHEGAAHSNKRADAVWHGEEPDVAAAAAAADSKHNE